MRGERERVQMARPYRANRLRGGLTNLAPHRARQISVRSNSRLIREERTFS